jgi:exopolysaccharide biosynthesis protein
MVLSLSPGMMDRFQGVGRGAVLRISTASLPVLISARTALSGGPLLVHNGKRQKIRSSPEDPYEFSSMLEQHPRTAFGWNKQWYFLVEVDGRQRDLSVGMTLDELSAYLVKLGCEEALNLDGGGSSSLWFEGQVRNNPCDGYERTIANSLLVVRKGAGAGEKGTMSKSPANPVERSKGNGN